MRRIGIGLLTITSLLAGCASSGNVQVAGQDKPPPPGAIIRRASTILPPQIITGRNYTIDEQVVLDGYSYIFKLRTPYGALPAKTIDLLELRLREMYSIEAAAQLSQQAHVMEGVLAGLEGARAGLAALLADPAGTLREAPEGLRRKVDEVLNPADRRAGSEIRRNLAARVGCDPETRNPILKVMLDEMSIRQQIGSYVTGSAMDLVLPGMSLLPTTAEMRQLVRTMPPHVINERVETEMKRAGLNPQLSERFCRQTEYTTLQRLLFLQCLRYLRGIPGQDSLLAAACNVKTEADCLESLHQAKFLAELAARRGLKSIFRAGLTGAVMSDGSHVLVLIADEVAAPDPLAGYLAEYRRICPNATAILLTTARLQPAINATLKSYRITLP